MRPKSLILLALALGCGLVASIGISQVLDGNQKTAAVETVPIYVALQNINLGDPVSEVMVSLEEWPKERVPMGAITTWEDIEDRRPRSPIFQGEPLLDTKLLPKGQINDPTQGVPKNMRLITIGVTAQKSAAGLLGPGDRVDLQLFAHRNDEQGILEPFTKIFMQNVRVYAVDVTFEKAADGVDARTVPKTVSLVVTPKQANAITFAQSLGEVSLIPRNPDDETVIDEVEVGIEDILGRGTANNRRKEQLVPDNGKDSGPLSDLGKLFQQAITRGAPTPTQLDGEQPFQMTIIFPDEVQRVRFTANGEPIPQDRQAPGAAAPLNEFTGQGASPVEEPEAFPIDLRLP